MKRTQLISIVSDAFRRDGYCGTSLKLLSEATGLNRSSLYHHFPGGKSEMADVVLEYLMELFERELFMDLRRIDLSPEQKISLLQNNLNTYFKQGYLGCILPAFSVGVETVVLRPSLNQLLKSLLTSIAIISKDLGVKPEQAELNAEQVLILLEGSLVLSNVREDNTPFLRMLERLPQELTNEVCYQIWNPPD